MRVVVRFALAALVGGLHRTPSPRNCSSNRPRRRRRGWSGDRGPPMFIHRGLYALPARHEWVKKNER
jgi:hypothetical protein